MGRLYGKGLAADKLGPLVRAPVSSRSVHGARQGCSHRRRAQFEPEEFQQAVRRLAREVRLTGTPRQMAERTFQMDPQTGRYLFC